MNTRRLCNEILADLTRDTHRAPDVIRQAVGAVSACEYDDALRVLALDDEATEHEALLKMLLSRALRNPARVVLDGLAWMAGR